MNGRRLKTAFILGAGLGLRLRPLTENCPKPLLPVGGRPIITYAMDHMLSVGVDRFIVNTHHCPEIYPQKFPDSSWRGVPITFRYEPVLLETAGGLKNIADLLEEDEAILCYNGDTIADIPLHKLIAFHEEKKPEVTMLLRSNGPLLNVNINGRGEVCDIRNTYNNPGVQSCLFAGVYAMETSILRHIEDGRKESIASTWIRRIADQPGSVMGIVIDEGIWHDVGSVEEYSRLKDQPGTLEK